MPVMKSGLHKETYEQWDFTLKNNGKINNTIWRQSKLTAKGMTALRVIPEVFEGRIEPQYVEDGNGELGLSGFVREARGLSYAGPGSITFLTEPRDLPDECSDMPCPTSVIVKVVRDRVMKDRTMSFPRIWEAYTRKEVRNDGQAGYKDAMHKPERAAYVQCIVSMRDGAPIKSKQGGDASLFPCVLKISQSTALGSFFQQLRTPLDPDTTLSAENNQLGDITSAEFGRMLTFDSEKEYNEQLKKEQDKYFAKVGEPWPLQEEFILNAFLPWEKVLNYPTLGELLHKLAEIWDPSAVVYGLKDTPYEQYVPADLIEQATELPADTPSAAKAPVPPPRKAAAPTVPRQPPVASPAAKPAQAPTAPATRPPPPPLVVTDDDADAVEAGMVGTPPPPPPARAPQQSRTATPAVPRPPAPAQAAPARSPATPPPAPKASAAAAPKGRPSQAELSAMIAKARKLAPAAMASQAPAPAYQPTAEDMEGIDMTGGEDDTAQE